ncbi:MAG: helix-turn-helix transcriptional regulator [Bacteroidaceae bacterium]|nr:helix-turn-helix transcriptional regulator [Bacteroidaceae bacterium]
MLQAIITSMPMFVCAVFTALLWLDLRHRPERYLLAVFFSVTTLLYLGHCIFFNHATLFIPLSDTIYAYCNVAVYPLYYIYIASLTTSQPTLRAPRLWFPLLPTFVCGTAIGVLYLLMSHKETEQFLETYLYGAHHAPLDGLAWWQAVAHDAAKVVFALQILPVVMVGLRHIRRFNHAVEENYADTEGRSLRTLGTLLWLFLLTSLTSFASNVVGRQWFGTSLWLLAIPSVAFTVLLFCIGRTGLRQNFSILDLQEEEQKTAAPEEEKTAVAEKTKDDGTTTWQQRIVNRIVDEQLFLRPDLKLDELARQLGTNRTYLSQAINEVTHLSFSDFINSRRIAWGEQLKAEHPDMSVNDIMHKCGFASYSSFHRNWLRFKQAQR